MKWFWKTKPKVQRPYPQSLMAVDERGCLVLDHKALKEARMPTTPHGREGLILEPCKVEPRTFFPSRVIRVSRATD